LKAKRGTWAIHQKKNRGKFPKWPARGRNEPRKGGGGSVKKIPSSILPAKTSWTGKKKMNRAKKRQFKRKTFGQVTMGFRGRKGYRGKVIITEKGQLKKRWGWGKKAVGGSQTGGRIQTSLGLKSERG